MAETKAREDEQVTLIQIRANRKPHDYRCRNNIQIKGSVRGCGRFLLRAALVPGAYIEIRCPKCGRMTVIEWNTLCPECGGEYGTHQNDCPDWVA